MKSTARDLKRVVVKLSGSIFTVTNGAERIHPFVTLFKGMLQRGIQSIIVAGGGETARRHIDVARSLGGDEAFLDEIGIAASRLNASLLIAGLGDAAHQSVPRTLEEVAAAVEGGRIVVSGGLHPGHSTNATAAIIAERVKAGLFVNATDVDGVYTHDPSRDPRARRLRTVSTTQLLRILSKGPMVAGTYELLDLVAIRVISRSKIPTRLVKCTPKNIDDALVGKPVGTAVTSD